MLKLHGFILPQPTEEDVRLAAEIRVAKRLRNQQLKHARKIETLPPDQWPAPPPGGLKRGPKANPFRVKCDKGRHTQLTKREDDAVEALRKQLAPHATTSVFLRWMICRELERHRRKDCLTMPFAVDLNALDTRSQRAHGAARSAARWAA